MPRTFTGTQLVASIRERADMENSNFCSDTEILKYISASYAELYDLLVKHNSDFYTTEETLTGDGSTKDFAIASDHYGTVGVDYEVDSTNGVFSPLRRLQPGERNEVNYSGGGPARAYRFVYSSATASLIRLQPTPGSGETYRHSYVVAPTDITSAATTLEGVSGWEEYIIIDGALKCAFKEESSTTYLERAKAMLVDRIEAAAENRSIDVVRITSSRHSYDFDPSDRRRWR